MSLHSDARIIVKDPEGEPVGERIGVETADQIGATHAAKTAMRARRRFIVRYQSLALQPVKVLGEYLGPSAECTAMRFPAHRAMAIHRAAERTGSMKLHAATEAAAVQHEIEHGSLAIGEALNLQPAWHRRADAAPCTSPLSPLGRAPHAQRLPAAVSKRQSTGRDQHRSGNPSPTACAPSLRCKCFPW